MMRVFVIGAVIATHLASAGSLYGVPISGGVWMISHVSRNLFIFLTALVLMYNYGFRDKMDIKTFYLKRFGLVLIPYAVWTFIYQIKDGIKQTDFNAFAGVFLHNFLTADAMYHLYFLVVSMQIYLLFPLLRHAYRKIKASPWVLLGVSFALQVVMTVFMQYAPNIPGLAWWLQHPDNFIMSYQFYVVAGVVIAEHMDTIPSAILRLRKKIYVAALSVAVIGLGVYIAQLAAGAEPSYAAAVFQPFIVVASVAYGLALLAFSLQWVKSGMRFGKPVAAVAEDSFGIYLSHALFLTYFSDYFQTDANDWYVVIATMIIGLPACYAVSFLFAEIARRTWLSTALTGRKMAKVPWASLRNKWRRAAAIRRAPF